MVSISIYASCVPSVMVYCVHRSGLDSLGVEVYVGCKV